MKNKEIRVRSWVYIDGSKFFGPGRAELLSLIKESGSISKAAKAMGMSYKKAWAMIDEMNSLGQKPYVITQKGGHQGGGTALTETGKKAVAAYERLLHKIQTTINRESTILEFF